MSQPNSNSVVLTEAEVAQSKENKKKRHRTVSQLPVFRSAVMLLDLMVDITTRSPKAFRKFTDSSFEMVNEILRYIGLSQEYRDETRYECITEAISFVYVLKAHFAVYQNRGILSKDVHNKTKKVCENTIAQLVAWRSSVNREGSVTE